MFFKAALLYRFTQPFAHTAEALAEALASKPARTPATQEVSTYGFVAPFKGGELVESAGGAMLIAARHEYRDLSAGVIRSELKAKVEQIEADQMRKVYKKERDQLKDEIVQALLPRAFLKAKTTFAMILGGFVVINATSAKAAEDLLSTLRECLGSLPVRPVSVKVAPSATLTDWLKNEQAATGFTVLDECDLRDTQEDGGTVRCKQQDLTSEEVKLHLSAGKVVSSLALSFEDKLSFVLDDKLTIKRLRFEDLLQDQAEQDGGEDAHGQLVASLTIAAGTLTTFIGSLLDALGGEEVPEGI